MKTCDQLQRGGIGRGLQVDDGNRAFTGDVPHRIHTNGGTAAGRPRQIVRTWATATPVADISRVTHEHHLVRSHTDSELAQDLAGVGVQFQEPVRQVGADIEAAAVGAHGQARRNFFLPARRSGGGQRQRVRGAEHAIGAHTEHLQTAIDVAQEDPLAIRRINQTRVAHLPFGIRLEDVGGRHRGLGFIDLLRRQRHALEDFAGHRAEHQQLAGFARDEQSGTVGRKRQHLRAQTGQFDLPTQRGQGLVDRSD